MWILVWHTLVVYFQEFTKSWDLIYTDMWKYFYNSFFSVSYSVLIEFIIILQVSFLFCYCSSTIIHSTFFQIFISFACFFQIKLPSTCRWQAISNTCQCVLSLTNKWISIKKDFYDLSKALWNAPVFEVCYMFSKICTEMSASHLCISTDPT